MHGGALEFLIQSVSNAHLFVHAPLIPWALDLGNEPSIPRQIPEETYQSNLEPVPTERNAQGPRK